MDQSIRFGPHVQHPTPAALAWARRASIVKALDDPSPLAAAHPDALLIFRAVMNDWGTQLAQPIGFFQTTMARLDSFRAKGRLFVELLNEVPPDHTAPYISFARQVVPLFHAAGLLVIGPNFATGDYNLDDWAEWRRADWAGLDLIGVHAYWSLKGPTPWNGYRWRTYYDPTLDGRELVVTECGHDRVRDGDGGVYLGKGGWKQDGLTVEQAAAELNAYAHSLRPHESAVAFTAGAYPSQSYYDLDSIAPLIEAAVAPPQPKPVPEKKPMIDYAKALWFPSPNYGYPQGTDGRNGYSIVAMVDHIESGSETATDGEFEHNGTEKSATYSVAKNGDVHQYVREANAAWANGIRFSLGYAAYKSDLSIPWMKECWDRQISPNLRVISIEHEGLTGEAMTEAQYQSSLALKRDILARHPEIPRSRLALLGHHHIDNVTRSRCPGTGNNRERFLRDLGLKEDDLTDQQKAAVLDHLGVIWGESKAATIAANPAESERAIHERIVAIKVALGLNG